MAKASSSGGSGETQTSRLCGCKATRHPAFTNCLGCGLIYCSEERDFLVSSGGKCVFCGSCECNLSPQELQAQGLTPIQASAYALKDKLLQFDLENAKRSHVRDAQADYYETSDRWLSDEEKAKIDEQQRLRREGLKPQNRRVHLSLTVDKTGRRVTSATTIGAATADDGDDVDQDGHGRQLASTDTSMQIVNDCLNVNLLENRSAAGDAYRLFLAQRKGTKGEM